MSGADRHPVPARLAIMPLQDYAESRRLPADTEIEQALLGAILINSAAYSRVSEFLLPEHFANGVHGRIYAAIGKLVERGQPADVVLLRHQFDQDGALADIGGAQYLAQLIDSAVTVLNAEHYGRRIRATAQRRALISACEDTIVAAYGADPDTTVEGLVDAHLRRLPATPVDAFGLTCAADLAGMPVPDRPWLVRDWIPRRQVTLLSGDGGAGKTICALILQVAAATGQPWFGLDVERCRSLGLYAEDDDDELHHRLADIVSLTGTDWTALCDMHWRSVVNDDETALVEADHTGAIRPTAYFRRVRQAALAFRARLLILDAATNFYGGDENRRNQVNGYVRLLRRLAIEMDGAIVLLAHPSLQGLSTGSGLSGSTHWHNAVRSRLYLTRTAGDDADPDERELTRLKANYAGAGDVLRLRWQRGGFIALEPPSGVDRAALGAKGDRVFRALLTATYAQSTWTCPSPTARNYAPTLFAKHPDREGLSKPALEAAMHRLIKAGTIKTETYGRPSEPRSRLALA